jgi:ABC-type glycerol-3-phosphate transport system substrate-binding protein
MLIGELSDVPPLSRYRWGMMPLPSDARPVTGVSAEGYVISAETQHPDACWEWITFLSQQMGGLMPARKSLAESTAYEQQVGEEMANVTRVSMDNVLPIAPEALSFRYAGEIFSQAVDMIVDEGVTPQEAMDWAQREAELQGSTEG